MPGFSSICSLFVSLPVIIRVRILVSLIWYSSYCHSRFSVVFTPTPKQSCVQPLPQYFSARNLGALTRPGIGYLKKTPQCSPVPGRFPFNKYFGLKFRKFHMPNGTVHSGLTDPFQATACLLIVSAASRIQKSGTGPIIYLNRILSTICKRPIKLINDPLSMALPFSLQ